MDGEHHADALRARLQATLGSALQVGERLGHGGFATVYRARDPRLERDVALKVVDVAGRLDDAQEAEFLHEARVLAGVEHPHIVPLYEVTLRDGLLVLAMRLVPGDSLQQRLAGTPLPAREAARVASEVASALAAAHAKGIVHRDVKPANILFDADGHAVVTDFGLALVTSRSTAEAMADGSGTPHYMSPEQALGEAVDGRSDVYALGVVLYEMLTGLLPFDGRTPAELMARVIATPAPSVHQRAPQTPTALAALVARMLAKEPTARPTASEVVAAVARIRTPEGLLSPAEVTRRARFRRLRLVALVAVTAVVVVAGLVYASSALVRLLLDDSPEPRLAATGDAVPPALVAAARSRGLLRPDEVVRFAFVPSEERAGDALLVTDEAMVRLRDLAARRYPRGQLDVTFYTSRRVDTDTTNALLVVTPTGGTPDTLYHRLHGRDVLRLGTALYSLRRRAPR
ncbi:serine/threonine-protein kinase [Gemmatimonas sp.]|uniref:serine/threonine-protein kinase n=1 Tax=Gemmatimonas sp. TaxID=1962908 RepID=UPI0025C3739D|nr:serine/threonine-protein kinase [Gemmatimonas sp.]MCA2983027.1 serine/threonine protein kinase [Gemmatimonas sp.]